ncbi:MAG: peptidylprolyl isomerase [Rickettsiales bacterium]|nr:peptidylprolyl isomerase [Rickettsiales bacterium]
MKKLLAPLFISASLLAGVAYADDYVILKLDDQKIKASEVKQVWGGLFPPGAAPEWESFDEKMKQNVLRGIISEHLLFEEAKKDGLDDSAEIKKQLEALKRKLVVRGYLDKKSEDLISEKDVKAEYDAFVRDMRDAKEIRARHILVKEEETAKEIIEKLDDDASFEALAKEYSKDPGSAKQGGDLGYFTKERMVPEFSKAAFALDEGDVSKPVKSDFGWHIIKLEDKRDVKIPTYNDVKSELRKSLEEEKLNAYMEDLIDQTSVTYYGPNGKEKDFSKTPDTTQE